MFTCGWAWPAGWPIGPILDFRGSSQICEIPCLGRWWTAVQNLTPLALSLAEKSVAVQTHTKLQTVTDISTPCLSACVDNEEKLEIWNSNESFLSVIELTSCWLQRHVVVSSWLFHCNFIVSCTLRCKIEEIDVSMLAVCEHYVEYDCRWGNLFNSCKLFWVVFQLTSYSQSLPCWSPLFCHNWHLLLLTLSQTVCLLTFFPFLFIYFLAYLLPWE